MNDSHAPRGRVSRNSDLAGTEDGKLVTPHEGV